MPDESTAVFAIYASNPDAEKAVGELIQANFSKSSISVLLPGQKTSTNVAHELIECDKEHQAPEWATAGVTAGGVVGGAIGLLAGIGALAIPGVGPFIAAGPLMSVLAGLGVGSAVGGLLGTLVGMGIPEAEAEKYEKADQEWRNPVVRSMPRPERSRQRQANSETNRRGTILRKPLNASRLQPPRVHDCQISNKENKWTTALKTKQKARLTI